MSTCRQRNCCRKIPFPGQSGYGAIWRSGGLSLVEVLVATVLIAVVLVPAMEALAPGVQGSTIHASRSEQHYHLAAGLEQVLAEPFALLDQEAQRVANPAMASNYSDNAGDPLRRLVFLSRYDADNGDADGDPFTGSDAGLLWIRVEIAGTSHAIETLVSHYD